MTVNTVLLHRETDGTGANSADAEKAWVNANIQITPATATNPVGTNHVLTITVNAINGTLDAGVAHRDRTDRVGPRQLRRPRHLHLHRRRGQRQCTVTITSASHRHDGRLGDLRHPGQRPDHQPHHQHGRQHGRRRQRQRQQAVGPARRQHPDQPATATNAVDTNHTLTGHVNVSDDGTTFTQRPGRHR